MELQITIVTILRASYGMSIVKILEKIDCVKTASHIIHVSVSDLTLKWPPSFMYW